MAELVCAPCRHPVRKHGEAGCDAGDGSCWCDRTSAWFDVGPPVEFVLPPAPPVEPFFEPGDPGLLVPEDLPPLPPKWSAPLSEPTPPSAPPAVGEVLGSWPSYVCEPCGRRRFEAFSCCARAATAVTVTLTRREVSGG